MGGSYECRPSNSPPAKVTLVVLEGELPAAMQSGSTCLSSTSLMLLPFTTIPPTCFFNLLEQINFTSHWFPKKNLIPKLCYLFLLLVIIAKFCCPLQILQSFKTALIFLLLFLLDHLDSLPAHYRQLSLLLLLLVH